MRATMRAALVVIGTAVVGVSAGLAAPSHLVPGVAGADALVETVQYWRGDRCERLRRACVHKEYRGEVGEGNCRRYREECGGGTSNCERLRRACVHKEYRGEVGEGNCRRYRNECGDDD